MPIFKNILLQAKTIPVIICHLVIQYKKGQFFTKSTAIWVYHLLPNYLVEKMPEFSGTGHA